MAESEYETYYREVANSGSWRNDDPNLCGCGGHGWWLSQLDTWHQCPIHGAGILHPDDSAPEEPTVTYDPRVGVVPPLYEVGYPSDPEDDLPF